MCIICSELVGSEAWSESVPISTTAEVSTRSRLTRGEILSAVARVVGVEAGVEAHGVGYSVSDRKGRTELASSLEEAWLAIERLSGRRIDPLDESLLGGLSEFGS